MDMDMDGKFHIQASLDISPAISMRILLPTEFNTWRNIVFFNSHNLSLTAFESIIKLLKLRDLSAENTFLRATAECFARLCHRLGVCLSVCPSVSPSVRPSVCHTRDLYQNNAS